MRSEDVVVEQVSAAIAALIRHRAGVGGLSSVGAVKRLCSREFGVAVRSIIVPIDYFGEVRGDIDADNVTIIVNAAQPIATQMRILLHELAECLAMRGAYQFGEVCVATIPSSVACCPVDLRHQVAIAVEMQLATELGLDIVRSSWKVGELLRVFPLDPKYIRPRLEIEHVREDVVI